jgi:hypothetical protein
MLPGRGAGFFWKINRQDKEKKDVAIKNRRQVTMMKKNSPHS